MPSCSRSSARPAHRLRPRGDGQELPDRSARSEGSRGGASRRPVAGLAARLRTTRRPSSRCRSGGSQRDARESARQVLVVDFIFTRCTGPCPILTARNVELQRWLDAGLRERVRFVSISLDPANDTPEALTAYAAARGADLSRTGRSSPVRKPTSPKWCAASAWARCATPDGNIDHALATFLSTVAAGSRRAGSGSSTPDGRHARTRSPRSRTRTPAGS